jgi:DNA-binding response OmpR family regulator
MSHKLLLADDSVTIQRVVELTFSGENIDVVTVSDGEQAIARISADPPDIVLADIAMPKKNGYEVAAFVKDHPTLSKVPVLLLAGAFEPVDEERAKQVRSDGVLVKPFETHEVIARVRELIAAEPRQPAPAATPPVAHTAQAATSPAAHTAQAATSPAAPAHTAARSAVPAASAPPPVREPAELPKAAAGGAKEIDDYFDRLDTAFASRQQNPPRPFPHLTPPTLQPDKPPVFAATAAAPEVPSPAPAAAFASSPLAADADQRGVIAGLFAVFLEIEQGQRDAASVSIRDEIERIRRRSTTA